MGSEMCIRDRWTPVQLRVLNLRDNRDRTSSDHYWACVQVNRITIDAQIYSLSSFDAHISLGSWAKTPTRADPWCRYFDRVAQRLAETQSLEFKMLLNASISSRRSLFFKLMVHSSGGTILHSSRQTLNACGLAQVESIGRKMSPPGSVFYLSGYDSMR